MRSDFSQLVQNGIQGEDVYAIGARNGDSPTIIGKASLRSWERSIDVEVNLLRDVLKCWRGWDRGWRGRGRHGEESPKVLEEDDLVVQCQDG